MACVIFSWSLDSRSSRKQISCPTTQLSRNKLTECYGLPFNRETEVVTPVNSERVVTKYNERAKPLDVGFKTKPLLDLPQEFIESHYFHIDRLTVGTQVQWWNFWRPLYKLYKVRWVVICRVIIADLDYVPLRVHNVYNMPLAVPHVGTFVSATY